jgi:hypothetical protein
LRERLLFDKRQDETPKTVSALHNLPLRNSERGLNPAWRKNSVGVVMLLHGQAELLEVVDAVGSPRRLTGRLHGRQQQSRQHADDGDDDQQFHERKRAALAEAGRWVQA